MKRYTIPQVGDRFEIQYLTMKSIGHGREIPVAYCYKNRRRSRLCVVPILLFAPKTIADQNLKVHTIFPKGTVWGDRWETEHTYGGVYSPLIGKPVIVSDVEIHQSYYPTGTGVRGWKKIRQYTLDYLNS